MSIIRAESVAITKSRLAKGFNGDNLNLNGRVISLQEADAGFKAAGNVKTPYVAVIASGNQKGYASGAAVAFNDYVKDIHLNKYNAEAVVSRYFDDMQAVVEKCDIEGSKLSIAIVCVYDDCVIAAKSGNCHILRFSEGELFEIALSDDDGGRGFQFVDVVTEGDMFALVGEEASSDLDYDGIVNAFDNTNDLKEKLKEFYKVLSIRARGMDCSVVLIKLECDSDRTYAAAPLAVSSDDEDVSVSPEKFSAEPAVTTGELKITDNSVSEDDVPETGKKPENKKKKILGFIPIAVLVVIIAVTVALYLATRPSNPLAGNEPSSGADTPIFNEDNTASDDDFNGSNGMQSVDDTEHGGDVDAPEDEETTKKPERETEAQRTEKPEETEATTEADETTTAADDETTTASDDETTTADSGADSPEETTTAEQTEAPADDEDSEGGEAEPAGDE